MPPEQSRNRATSQTDAARREQEMMLLYHVPAGGELDGPFMA